MNANNGASNSSVHQYLSFSLAEEIFAVPVCRVREIMDFSPVTKVPQTPDYVLGVINLRGSVVPVIDLRGLLGLPGVERSRESCIVVIEIDLEEEILIIGAVVDAVNEVFDLADDLIDPPPRLGTKMRTEFIHGLAHVEDRLIICLDIEKVLTSDQLEMVQESIAS